MLLASGALLLSNAAGRGASSGQGASGAPGDGLTCSSSNCHGSQGPFAPELKLELNQDGVQVNEYTPGESYQLSVSVNATSGDPSRYGFQMTTLFDIDNTFAGEFSNISDNAQSVSINDRIYIEHNGPSGSDEFSANWTAPSEGSGSVTLYAAGVVTNGNGNTSGDSGTLGSLSITEADLSNIKVLTPEEMRITPNPASDFVLIDTELNQEMTYDMISINGLLLASGKLTNKYIDLSEVNSGMYIISVRGEDFVYRQKVYKR